MKFLHFLSVILLLCIFSTLSSFCCGAKILGIFPMPFKSMFTCTNAVMKSLIDAGHEVTVITPFSKEATNENYSSIIDLSKKLPLRINSLSYNQHRHLPAYPSVEVSFKYEKTLCDLVFNLKEYQDLLVSNNTFDVILIEVMQIYQCFLPIAKKLNIPVIGVNTARSWYNVELVMKNTHHPADVPFELIVSWKFNDFYHRVINVWSYIVVKYFWVSEVVPFLERFHREHEGFLKPYEGYLDIEPVLMFSNGHHTILPRSQNPNVIEIGGIQVKPAKPLPKNVQSFIDEAENGVIVFTFGSNAKLSSLPDNMINIFMEIFAKIPQRVICKFEKPMENVPNNVMLMEWLPQRDILGDMSSSHVPIGSELILCNCWYKLEDSSVSVVNIPSKDTRVLSERHSNVQFKKFVLSVSTEHPNVKAFISHCGQGGVYEAIYSATPVIACPLHRDQPSNAAILEHLGVAVHLDIDSISKQSLLEAINSIINDTRYYHNMQRISKAFKDRPLTPQQTVVFWTEYVIKHKDALNLMPPSAKLNWFQYYLLDIFLLFVVVSVAVIYILRIIIGILITILRKKINLFLNVKNKSM